MLFSDGDGNGHQVVLDIHEDGHTEANSECVVPVFRGPFSEFTFGRLAGRPRVLDELRFAGLRREFISPGAPRERSRGDPHV